MITSAVCATRERDFHPLAPSMSIIPAAPSPVIPAKAGIHEDKHSVPQGAFHPVAYYSRMRDSS